LNGLNLPSVQRRLSASLLLHSFLDTRDAFESDEKQSRSLSSAQDELDSIKAVIRETLIDVTESLLIEGQTFVSLDILTLQSVGGSAVVDYSTVVKQDCQGCDETTVAASLYNQTSSGLEDEVGSGNFQDALNANAQSSNITESFANITNVTVSSNGYVILTKSPSASPSTSPSKTPSDIPSKMPSEIPSKTPSEIPSQSQLPTISSRPSYKYKPSSMPSTSSKPSESPSSRPSSQPSSDPSSAPSKNPSLEPSSNPSSMPSTSSQPFSWPSSRPSESPSSKPSSQPSSMPSESFSPTAPFFSISVQCTVSFSDITLSSSRAEADVLERTLSNATISFLSEDQSLESLFVTEINGISPDVNAKEIFYLRRKAQAKSGKSSKTEWVDVEYISVIKADCTGCNEAITALFLYKKTSFETAKVVSSDEFASSLIANAENVGVDSLSQINDVRGACSGYTISSQPTNHPTKPPTTQPTKRLTKPPTKRPTKQPTKSPTKKRPKARKVLVENSVSSNNSGD
jgi:insulin receptor substrate 1